MDVPGTHVTRAFHAQEKSSTGASKTLKRQKNAPFKPFGCDRQEKVVHWYIGVPGVCVTRAFCGQEKSSTGTRGIFNACCVQALK
jgi:hypothetical protein